jgi:hypothetical protein
MFVRIVALRIVGPDVHGSRAGRPAVPDDQGSAATDNSFGDERGALVPGAAGQDEGVTATGAPQDRRRLSPRVGALLEVRTGNENASSDQTEEAFHRYE